MAAVVEGQMTIFDVDMSYLDKHYDRYGREIPAKFWKDNNPYYRYDRCENCSRWVRVDVSEQPPAGWGVYGFCQEHKQRCLSGSYCNLWLVS